MRSATDLLALHALRLKGHGDPAAIAARFDQDPHEVAELLLDFQANGWARRAQVPGAPPSWTLTDAGRQANELMLAQELAATESRELVAASHRRFLPLNARFQLACTRWQLRPAPGDPMAINDHTDFGWDDRVLAELRVLGNRLRPLSQLLGQRLDRFAGYDGRYAAAIARVDAGSRDYVDGVGVDSCHRVWFELHEDLLASLGIARGQEEA